MPDSFCAGTKTLLDRVSAHTKTSEFGAISVTEWSYASPISNVESQISDRCSYYNGELFESARKTIRKSVTIA